MAGGQQTQTPATASPPKVPTRGPSEASSSPGPTVPSEGTAWINPAPPVPSISPPLAYPTTRAEPASRVEELLGGAASLVAQGNLSKAMESYNEALRIAPHYAEAYRQRALTLLRLGDRVRAQADYARFLELDPQSRNRVHEEIQLFEESGYARVGEAVGPPYGAASLGAVAAPGVAVIAASQFQPAQQADMDYVMAREAFLSGNYQGAFRWAQWADEAMPQVRIHALKAQILFAQGAYRGAAAEARAAAAMGPLVDWTTLYGYYDYRMPQYQPTVSRAGRVRAAEPVVGRRAFPVGLRAFDLGSGGAGARPTSDRRRA